MGAKFSLDGGMIPRTVKRMVDERREDRVDADAQTAVLCHRGRDHVVRLVNLSSSGAMVIFSAMPHIGEEVTLQLLGRDAIGGHVLWVRDGRIGVNFTAPLE
ncbi:MAG TPA: PilZ domain-containing protein [Sphingomicrobium sp.]|nr:PilZ domain-containing protein [Sphingomicrobium sp.]